MLTGITATIQTQPFVKIAPAFIAGIVLQWYMPLPAWLLLGASLLLLLLLLLFVRLPMVMRYRYTWLQGTGILLLLLLAGCAVVYCKDVRNKNNWFGHLYQPGNTLYVEIIEPPVLKQTSYTATARVLGIKTKRGWEATTGKLCLYLQKDSATTPLQTGSRLLFTRSLQRVQNSGNPGGFDYSRYCAFQNMYHQVWLQRKDYVVLPPGHTSLVQQYLYRMQGSVVRLLQNRIPGKAESALAEALLIGYRNDLDKTLLQSYSDTGLVHIIAISGLHLGMLYGVLMGALFFLRRKPWQRLLRGVLVLVVLWLFTLLAGAGASVVRAALMFSFITVAGMLGRVNSPYNNLAASACCLLLYDPFCLWDVGFQLSYAAVLGIALFYKPISHWVLPQNRLVKNIWQLMALSIAAQVLTLPLVLFYFHQFPLLFLFSNLLVVPLSGIVLYGELLLLLVQCITPLAVWCGKAIGWLVMLMNALVARLGQLPFARISQVHVYHAELLLWFAVVLLAAAALLFARRNLLLPAVAGLVLLALVQTGFRWHSLRQQYMVVYNIPGTAAAELVTGRTSWLKCDAAVTINHQLQQSVLLPAHTQLGIDETHVLRHFLYRYHGKIIGFLPADFKVDSFTGNYSVDILILSNSPHCTVAQLQQWFHCKQLVFDSSNPLWKIQKWKKDCDSLHLRFHSVPEQGAFVASL
ncbi:ComEC/Rec2 family competence protein [Deminuibacter soli]|uniref:ComEC family competence protein n=1 Tax=Deminuibacter soli TaxID=2291815 RepID=A0A3E1NFH1_9BACT|nr:ComEC/Rec2 family competence protein [Deminuibacter soli]RFM26726.1 ComEC family competence protein [Deminuibacter soli]